MATPGLAEAAAWGPSRGRTLLRKCLTLCRGVYIRVNVGTSMDVNVYQHFARERTTNAKCCQKIPQIVLCSNSSVDCYMDCYMSFV